MVSEVPLCDLTDGYWRIPPGKLANATAWLQMLERPTARAVHPLLLKRMPPVNTPHVRAVFNQIGASCLWDRTAQLNDEMTRNPWGPDDCLYFAYDDTDRHVGLLELARHRDEDSIEIAYLGLFPDLIGRGLGKRLMMAALAAAWDFDPRRVYLHTCNTDHPSALPFYLASGFKPFAAGFQIMDDPRLVGLLPRNSAPHVPLIDH